MPTTPGTWKRNTVIQYPRICKSYINHIASGLPPQKNAVGPPIFFFLNLKTAVFSGQPKHQPQNHKATQTLPLAFSLQHSKWGLLFLHTREVSTTEMKCTLTVSWGASCIPISQLPGRSSHHYSGTWGHTLMVANIHLGKTAEVLPSGMVSPT